MHFKVLIQDEETTVEINDNIFTPEELAGLVNRALIQEARARNIVARREIPFYHQKETAVHACLSHLDSLR